MKGMRNIAPFGLRMPEELREAVAESAKRNGRSMNSEIVQILENALSGPQVGSVRIGFGETDFVEINPRDHSSVVNGLVELMSKLQAESKDKKPT